MSGMKRLGKVYYEIWLFILTSLLITSCLNGQKDLDLPVKKNEHTNALIKESSPYLQQHAHNPVDWMPWGNEAFEKAKNEDKLVLISIGYSSCHWCHVMEHESFEDIEVAKVMNDKFVCLKVDREERPDVDQIYMTAVQLMTGSGGWPLNCFALPDGRPVFGGTYFQKSEWLEVLESLCLTYTKDKNRIIEYAENLTEGIQQSELISSPITPPDFKMEKHDELINIWKNNFDTKEGGMNRTPKFPLPNNYDYLMQ